VVFFVLDPAFLVVVFFGVLLVAFDFEEVALLVVVFLVDDFLAVLAPAFFVGVFLAEVFLAVFGAAFLVVFLVVFLMAFEAEAFLVAVFFLLAVVVLLVAVFDFEVVLLGAK